jgi:hypothetical protein
MLGEENREMAHCNELCTKDATGTRALFNSINSAVLASMLMIGTAEFIDFRTPVAG